MNKGTVRQAQIGELLGQETTSLEKKSDVSSKELEEIVVKLKEVDKNFNTLKGRNFEGELSRNFDLMHKQTGEVTEDLNEEQLELLKLVDESFLRNYHYMQNNSQLTPMEIKDDKVVLSPGIPHHTISKNDIEVIESISQMGILPSENFGHLESSAEGRYCAFLRKTPTSFTDKDFKTYYSVRVKELRYRMNEGVTLSAINLFIDNNHPLYKLLEKNDYFEYEHIKRQFPEKLLENYTPKQIKIFDELIEPYSTAGKDFHDNKKIGYFDWLAIPGGIPPQLVNGIALPKNFDKNKLSEYVDAIQKAFPQAVIFDYNQVVIAKPFSKGINPDYEKRAEQEQAIVDKLSSIQQVEYRAKFNSLIKEEKTMQNNEQERTM